MKFIILSVVCLLSPCMSRADNFRQVYYDPATDDLVIVVVYRGIHPHHQFALTSVTRP